MSIIIPGLFGPSAQLNSDLSPGDLPYLPRANQLVSIDAGGIEFEARKNR
jgi:hypothetical protein